MEQDKRTIIWVAVLFAVLFADALLEPFLVETENVTIASPELPESFDCKRIVFVSDIHYGLYFSRERLNELVRRINNMNPDLVLFGGDYIGNGRSEIRESFQGLAPINAPLGKYGVLGNHDYWIDDRLTIREMALANITPLDNSGVWVYSGGERIRVGGVGDLWHDKPNYLPAIEGVNDSDYVILLSHNPDYAEELPAGKVDLVLSGHTHGGQVTFFGIFVPYTNSAYGQRYRGGLVDNGKTRVYVSRGIGTVVLPVRFFSRPEITVLTLKKA